MEKKVKTKKKSPGKKMTQDQLALAIAKKRETDSKALKIVEKLIEPNIEVNFLLENLKDINKCHMDDVIEERAITKLCGYVLCDNPIINNIKQQYSISLKMNKVYDITKRKNFCSSDCYGAANYLLEQMLESPLWMRDKEIVPKFQLLSKENQRCNQFHGDEVNMVDHEHQVVKEKNIGKDQNDTRSKNQNFISHETEQTSYQVAQELSAINHDFVEKIDLNKDNPKPVEKLSESMSNYLKDVHEKVTIEDSIKIVNKQVSVENKSKTSVEDELKSSCEVDEKSTAKDQINKVDINIAVEDQLQNVDKGTLVQDNKELPVKDQIKEVKKKSLYKVKSKIVSSNDTIQNRLDDSRNSKLRRKHIQTLNVNLVTNIEENIYTWITKETVSLLFGDNTEKQRIVNEVKQEITQQDIYNALIKKLDVQELEEEREEQEILWNSDLKPLPNYADIEEEGKKLQLKVNTREKQTSHEAPVDEEKEDESYYPLQEARAPNSFRRKILMDKLDKILPNLMQALTGTTEEYHKSHLYSRTHENLPTIKVLVNTFNLTPKNVFFKTAEWNLVGLIVLKMLSLFDPWIQNLIGGKQASQFTSMILMSYKVELNYLDLFMASIRERFNDG